jgi:hypothetical protein
MAEPPITLVGRAHSIDLTSDPVRLKITTRHSQGKASLTADYRLQASQREVLEQIKHLADGQLIGVIGTLPAAAAPGAALTVTRLEILGKPVQPQQEVA